MAGLFEDGKENRLMNAIFFVNTKFHFSYLEPDFSNIIEVYNNNLNLWYLNNSDSKDSINGNNPNIINGILQEPENYIFSKTKDGFELTEVDFIDNEFKIFEYFQTEKLTFAEKKQFEFYTEYLSKHRSHIQWTLKDYYNHYINFGRFAFTYLRTFKGNEFNDLNKRLNEYRKQYEYIFKRLTNTQRIEFVNDFLDQLTKLKDKQTESKFIEVIQKMINSIKNEYNYFNTENDLKIREYKNAILYGFKNILVDNPANNFYYRTQLEFYKNSIVQTTGTKNEINHIFINLSDEVFKLFECYYKLDVNNEVENGIISNDIQSCSEDIKELLKSFKTLQFEIETDIELKMYCLKEFKRLKVFIEFNLCIDIENSPLNELFNKYEQLLNDIIIIEHNEPQQAETDKTDEVIKELHKNHNPNLWNFECYELFKYLYDEYYKNSKRQITNIWFYLKEYNSSKYIMSATKDLYKDFMKTYGINITNFDKAAQKWEDKEYKKIDEHRQIFEERLKHIAQNAKNT